MIATLLAACWLGMPVASVVTGVLKDAQRQAPALFFPFNALTEPDYETRVPPPAVIPLPLLPDSVTRNLLFTVWPTFDFPEDGFKIAAPYQPIAEEEQIKTPAGPAKARTYVFRLNRSLQARLRVTYLNPADTRSDIQLLRAGAEALKFRFFYQHGLPAGDLLTTDTSGDIALRRFVVGRKVYELAVSPSYATSTADGSQWLESWAPLGR